MSMWDENVGSPGFIGRNSLPLLDVREKGTVTAAQVRTALATRPPQAVCGAVARAVPRFGVSCHWCQQHGPRVTVASHDAGSLRERRQPRGHAEDCFEARARGSASRTQQASHPIASPPCQITHTTAATVHARVRARGQGSCTASPPEGADGTAALRLRAPGAVRGTLGAGQCPIVRCLPSPRFEPHAALLGNRTQTLVKADPRLLGTTGPLLPPCPCTLTLATLVFPAFVPKAFRHGNATQPRSYIPARCAAVRRHEGGRPGGRAQAAHRRPPGQHQQQERAAP